jgi:hypothetical protein
MTGCRRVLGAEQHTRKPILLFWLSGAFLFRYAERQFRGLLIQEPPRLVAYPMVSIQESEVRSAIAPNLAGSRLVGAPDTVHDRAQSGSRGANHTWIKQRLLKAGCFC